MLTNDQAAMLVKYYQTIQLTSEQKDRLICKYWEAGQDARKEIARAYAGLFGTDADFVQRLVRYYEMRQNAGADNGGSSATAAAATTEGSNTSSPSGSPTTSASGSPTFSAGSGGGYGSAATRLRHSQLLLRTAIQDQFPKLTGSGPFPISFEVVNSEEERREAVELYSSQFEHPDPPELMKLVVRPQSLSTRTRRRAKGSYTFYIRSLTTKEMVCAVTAVAHHYQTHHFVEMPLFATAAGYKKNGFGRLLNAALAEWCVGAGFEFTMISADLQAINFWRHLGYEMMSKSEKNGIAFYYEHECYSFTGAEPMIGYCYRRKRARDSNALTRPLSELSVADLLKEMTKFAVVGPMELPTP